MPVDDLMWPLAARLDGRWAVHIKGHPDGLSCYGDELGEYVFDWKVSEACRQRPAHCWQAPRPVVPPSQKAERA